MSDLPTKMTCPDGDHHLWGNGIHKHRDPFEVALEEDDYCIYCGINAKTIKMIVDLAQANKRLRKATRKALSDLRSDCGDYYHRYCSCGDRAEEALSAALEEETQDWDSDYQMGELG